MTGFDAAIDLARIDDNRWSAEIPQGWAQGRTVFGGLTAALGLRASQESDPRTMRAFDAYFVAPVSAGPAEILLEDRRSGRFLTQLGGAIVQDGAVVLRFRSVLAEPGNPRIDAVPAPPAPSAERAAGVAWPYIEGVMPELLQNFDMVHTEGPLPLSGGDRAVTGGYVRLKEPGTGEAALLAHFDAWPPAALAILTEPVPASSVRWSAHFHGDCGTVDGTEWSWVRTEAAWRSGGVCSETSVVVRAGRPVAWFEQTLALYM